MNESNFAKREQYILSGEEFERIKQALAMIEANAADAIWLMLWTAQRRRDVLTMRWNDIDWDNKTWTINGTTMVPLTTAAMAILNRRLQIAESGKWVFPSTSRLGHLTDLSKSWHTVRKQAAIDDLRLYDLRCTAAVMLAVTGANSIILHQVLGYSTAMLQTECKSVPIDRVREAMEKAAAWLSAR